MKTGFLTLMAATWLCSAFAGSINITDRSAKGDGRTDNTAIIQQAIRDCRDNHPAVHFPRLSYHCFNVNYAS